ncbi:MAG: prepilin-type N-terminal cleavage/methylation domain-containing protein [bacterium]|nr:prepilin-type N-terminal cleavage/methylation domain-containing protein [bacterium]
MYTINYPNRTSKSSGFTLIELLIVVAIIAILAAIAIPNFLAAQTRAKVADSESAMRTIATGLEAYAVDHNAYPYVGGTIDYLQKLVPLTTPVSYLASLPKYHWKYWIPYGGEAHQYYYYTDRQSHEEVVAGWGYPWTMFDPSDRRKWYLSCVGPDGDYDQAWDGTVPGSNYHLYDPTNGTVSNGDLIRLGP